MLKGQTAKDLILARLLSEAPWMPRTGSSGAAKRSQGPPNLYLQVTTVLFRFFLLPSLLIAGSGEISPSCLLARHNIGMTRLPTPEGATEFESRWTSFQHLLLGNKDILRASKLALSINHGAFLHSEPSLIVISHSLQTPSTTRGAWCLPLRWKNTYIIRSPPLLQSQPRGAAELDFAWFRAKKESLATVPVDGLRQERKKKREFLLCSSHDGDITRLVLFPGRAVDGVSLEWNFWYQAPAQRLVNAANMSIFLCVCGYHTSVSHRRPRPRPRLLLRNVSNATKGQASTEAKRSQANMLSLSYNATVLLVQRQFFCAL
ncbi:uncharacterized protein MYCFIDRAFT_171918 [Pseudocercospora fijiensis CIRAD86]|uniref:Uncharacterized protein n=1 Tax=Pseudocercospora fijiensis (strain CIRAD86) TaxID=383855 RepID=M2Z8J4_PSEFD|nr:uncharacterized protein MYCFIDRAFT_171918 [Pseudocercospora fijiensis CIRAD86]EME86110.1 hypothetical protein MYCFIDRAFT_171918 [Pseudocercospora fijiensis CIRAD86]